MWDKLVDLRAAASATKEIQRTGLSVQAPSLTNDDTLKITTVVRQIITELSEAVRKGQNSGHYKNGT
jgi:hypothetical protein